jgi:hypothetical protein
MTALLSYNEPRLNMESQGSDRSRTRALHQGDHERVEEQPHSDEMQREHHPTPPWQVAGYRHKHARHAQGGKERQGNLRMGAGGVREGRKPLYLALRDRPRMSGRDRGIVPLRRQRGRT